jgi:hypothetical protein
MKKQTYRGTVPHMLKECHCILKLQRIFDLGSVLPDLHDRITNTAMQFYSADSPLLPSGLLGPVRILAEIKME